MLVQFNTLLGADHFLASAGMLLPLKVVILHVFVYVAMPVAMDAIFVIFRHFWKNSKFFFRIYCR